MFHLTKYNFSTTDRDFIPKFKDLAYCKLGLTIVRPNSLSTPETLGNWTDGRILCRHSAPTSFFCYYYCLSLWMTLKCYKFEFSRNFA